LSRRASALMGMPRGFWAMISSAWKACWAVDRTRPDPRRPSPPLVVASGTATPFGGDRDPVQLTDSPGWRPAVGSAAGGRWRAAMAGDRNRGGWAPNTPRGGG